MSHSVIALIIEELKNKCFPMASALPLERLVAAFQIAFDPLGTRNF